MRLVWLVWLVRHFEEFGYSQGVLRGSIGTAAVALTALLVGYTVRGSRPAALAAGTLVGAAGITWLALH
ncbi:hypothetical protein ACFXA3_32925 [Streptomyces sp. NPDC059456]|uniref:hypothetical protein n=1 Tax=Streptomyces sp. NPDC059456 TaxID=3346838 RepID=UPI0036A0785C